MDIIKNSHSRDFNVARDKLLELRDEMINLTDSDRLSLIIAFNGLFCGFCGATKCNHNLCQCLTPKEND